MTDLPLPSKPLEGRIALVTGATRGIGFSIAKGLAQAGAHLVAVGRTQGALEALDDEIFAATGGHATLVPLDLREGDQIDALGHEIHRRWGRLDILVSAAGILGALTPASHVDPKAWDMVISVNLTANYRLIRSLETPLRASDAGRAVFLTSSLAGAPRAFWAPYAASKAGLEALVATWADELEQTSLRTVCLDPGRMRTRMRAQAYPGEDPQTLPHPDVLNPLVLELVRPDAEPPRRVVAFRTWSETGKV
ncbi:MAG: oxidoreductase [Caulobacteraceae bacterium]|nr:oxidoreductase [Caulobacteraceae bacterium]